MTCIYCDHKIMGSISRIRDHFVGTVGCGVKMCTKLHSVHEDHLNALRGEVMRSKQQAEARARKRKLDAIKHQPTILSSTSRKTVRIAVAEFFLGEAEPFRRVESPYFRNLLSAVADAGPSALNYLPCRQTLATTSTDEMYENLRALMTCAAKDRCPCTVVGDGWKNTAKDPCSVWLMSWADLSIFQDTFYTPGERRTADKVLEQMETLVGSEDLLSRTCQIITDCDASEDYFNSC